MKILRVEPKDFYVTFEVSLTDVRNIVEAMDKLGPRLVMAKEDDSLASSFNDLYGMFKEVAEDMKNGT